MYTCVLSVLQQGPLPLTVTRSHSRILSHQSDHQELFIFSKIKDLFYHTPRATMQNSTRGELLMESVDKQTAVCPKFCNNLLMEKHDCLQYIGRGGDRPLVHWLKILGKQGRGDSTQMTGRNVTIKVGLFPVHFLFPYFSFALSSTARNKFISFIFELQETGRQYRRQNKYRTYGITSINNLAERTNNQR